MQVDTVMQPLHKPPLQILAAKFLLRQETQHQDVVSAT